MLSSSSSRLVAARCCACAASTTKKRSLTLFRNTLLKGIGASYPHYHASLLLQPSHAYLHTASSSAADSTSRRVKSSLHLPYESPSSSSSSSSLSDNIEENQHVSSHHQFDDDSNKNMNITPDFSNTKVVYESKSTTDLIRAAITLRLCRLPSLVDHAEDILNVSRKVFGDTITDTVIKLTFFKHFCAGENEEDIRPVVNKLSNDAGVGSVLYYAAESSDESKNVKITTNKVGKEEEEVYTTEFELQADEHLNSYIDGIQNLTKLSGISTKKDDYAAIKITALGNPNLLRRISQTITETKHLFEKFDLNKDGTIGRDEFEQCYRVFFNDADTKMKDLFEQLDPDHDDQVDYITWSMTLSPKDIAKFTSNCKEVGPLCLATPTEEELELMDKVYDRAHLLAYEANKAGVRLLMDAEQVRFQPAIDNLVLDLQQTFNSTDRIDHPIIYNTYQCYRTDAIQRLRNDVERSKLFDYHFGGKLVRGAYMDSERELAKKCGIASPIHDTIKDTHRCYNNAVEFLLQKSMEEEEDDDTTNTNRRIEVMCATHNQESIEKAINVMNQHGINGTTDNPMIRFAQLYAMADHLSFGLGNHGYAVYKYLPYGDVQQVTAFLLRRAQENGAVLGGTNTDLGMIESELRRRFKSGLSLA